MLLILILPCYIRSSLASSLSHTQPAKALETARTANRRLREEIKATAEELAATKTQQGENARRHSQSLVAAKSALDEVRHSQNNAQDVFARSIMFLVLHPRLLNVWLVIGLLRTVWRSV